MEGVFNPKNPYKLVDETRTDIKRWTPHVNTAPQLDLKVGDAIEKLGYQFVWTHNHRTPAQLDLLRDMSDDYADKVLAKLSFKADQDTLMECIERAESEGGVFKEFVDHATAVPDWVDWKRISRGQDVFVRNGPASATALMYLSLVGGFGAPKINKVLTSTGYLANKNTLRRLFETSQMIIDCMEPDGLVPHKGVGWFSALRVRFLHGKVRQRLRNSDRWKKDEWGVPINQEDMIATILSFQFNVLFSLHVIGVKLTKEEVEDYTHLWRYIGYLSGVKEELNPCDDFFKTKALQESIFMHLVEPDESSVYMAHHVLDSLLDEKYPIKWSIKGHYQMARMLLREDFSALLKIPEDKFYYYHHLFLFFMMRNMTRLTYLPVIGNLLMKYNRYMLKATNSYTLGGRTTFTMSHTPSNESIDNLRAIQEETDRWRQLRKLRKSPILVRLLIVLAALYLIQKFVRIPYLSRILRQKRS